MLGLFLSRASAYPKVTRTLPRCVSTRGSALSAGTRAHRSGGIHDVTRSSRTSSRDGGGACIGAIADDTIADPMKVQIPDSAARTLPPVAT